MSPQPRERAVACWCTRTTWNISGLCDRHNEISDATPTASGAGHSSRPAGQHGPAAVLANTSP